MNTKVFKILTHVFIWSLFFFMFYHPFVRKFGGERSAEMFFTYSMCYVVYLLFAYAHFSWLLPRLYEQRRYLLYSVSILASIVVVVLLLKFIVHARGYQTGSATHSLFPTGYFVLFSFLYGGASALLYFNNRMNELKEKAIYNEKEKIAAELNMLKAQINPHLLFNTLNNIYSLSLENSKQVPEMILKLSDLMSYILYESKKSHVTMRSEIEFIENYIALEKMRFEDTIDVTLTTAIDEYDLYISPLLFIPFIENAFKHSIGLAGKQRTVNITFTVKDGKMFFLCENSFSENHKHDKNFYSGIGIKNVTKRLQYLYPERHDLSISYADSIYKVDLKIDTVCHTNA